MKRTTKLTGAFCGLFLIIGLAWHPVVEPGIVKFPGNVNRPEQYAGTFVVYVDTATGAQLATPTTMPLTIDRQIKGIPRATGAHVALVDEVNTVKMGPLSTVQENIYALNRRTMKNVSDKQAVTWKAGNAVDRSGTYYLTLPMNVPSKGASYKMWNQNSAGYEIITNATPATGKLAGTNVVFLKGDLAPTPVAPYELEALQGQGFPTKLSGAQLAGQLQAAGIDLTAATTALSKVLTPTEMTTLAGILTQSIPLQYYSYGTGQIAVEPKTGAIVQLSGIVDGISVKPDLTSLSPALSILNAHASDPTVAALLKTFTAAATAGPQPVYEMRYSQTEASVAKDAKEAKDQANQVRLATVTLPRSIDGIAVILVVVFALLLWRGRSAPTPFEQAEEVLPPARPERKAA